MNIWISSDWHLGHNNIVRGCTRWENKEACRPFESLPEHDETLIENINKCAKKDDLIYMLGDFSLGGKDNVKLYRERIRCKNIHLILGNHDIHIRKNRENIKGLFTSVNDILFQKIDGERYVFCHYSMRTWDCAHHGAIMLYGHSHGTAPRYGMLTDVQVKSPDGELLRTIREMVYFKTMDVGVDTHPEFRPYHLDEIRQAMSRCVPLRIDHHHHEEKHQ